MRTTTKDTTNRYPDLLHTDKGTVRVLSMNPDSTVTIKGREILVSQIPLCTYTLKCGHMGKGLAVDHNDLIFCERCKSTARVAKVDS